MVTKNNFPDSFPLVILDEDSRFIDLVLINEKAFSKSIENNVIWHLHSETEKLVPYKLNDEIGEEGLPFESLLQKDGYCIARLKISKAETSVSQKQKPTEKTQTSSSKEIDPKTFEVLNRLGHTIASRKKELPEGAYTTHLFNSGIDKIKKKLGEEAVEVILAATKDDMIYEAADLVFHLMVLLEAQELSLADVLEALKKRE